MKNWRVFGVLAILALIAATIIWAKVTPTQGQRRGINAACLRKGDCGQGETCLPNQTCGPECTSDSDCPDSNTCQSFQASDGQPASRCVNLVVQTLRHTIDELRTQLNQSDVQRAVLETKYNALVNAMNRVPSLDRPLPANWREATNFPGSDIRSMSLIDGSPAQCERECLADTRCRAWSFVLPGIQGPLAQCWLKNNGSIQGVPDGKVVSGIVQR